LGFSYSPGKRFEKKKLKKKSLIGAIVVVHLITSRLLSLRTFAGGCVIHNLTQHDQGYRLGLSYSPGKPIKKKNLIKNIIN
jgi:hypothetical protein